MTRTSRRWRAGTGSSRAFCSAGGAWRRTQTRTPEAAFIPVTLALPQARTEPAVPEAVHSTADAPPPSSSEASPHHADHRIEIELGNGRLVRVGAGDDAGALKRIVDAWRTDDPGSRLVCACG